MRPRRCGQQRQGLPRIWAPRPLSTDLCPGTLMSQRGRGAIQSGACGTSGGTLLDRQGAASVLLELSYWGDPEVGLRTGFIFGSGPPALVKFYSAWGLCWDSSFCAPGFLVHGFGPAFVETQKLCSADWTGLGHRFCNAGLTNSPPRFNPWHHLVLQPWPAVTCWCRTRTES